MNALEVNDNGLRLRALAVRPSLVLADEPTSMLDVSIRIDVLNLLSALKEEHGLAYLYITHDLASAHYFADRTVVLYRGQIVESAPAAQLIENPLHPYTRRLLAAVPGTAQPKRNAFYSDGETMTPVPPTRVDEMGPGCRFAAFVNDDGRNVRCIPSRSNAAGIENFAVSIRIYGYRNDRTHRLRAARMIRCPETAHRVPI